VSAEVQRLGNGLSVAVDPIAGAESIALGLYVQVGSRSEPKAIGGIAHLVEHMVFKGAGGRDTRALAEVIEDVGGSLNAWTARDQTAFHGRALARNLPLVAELIADLVRAPHFDEAHLEREKQVILSELGECLDSPEDLVHDHLLEAAFDRQALGRPVLGTELSIRAIQRQDCLDWLSREFRARARNLGIATNPAFAGTYTYRANVNFAAIFPGFLEGLPEGGLVMCHPGHVDAELERLDPLTTLREQEYAYFCGDAFVALLEKRGLTLN